VVEFSECKGCLYKEYKKVAKMTSKARIRPVSSKRVFVSKETYDKVFERCKGKCVLCDTTQALHLHHIDGRGKDKTDNPDNCVILCSHCHLEVVHKNNKYWRKKLKEMI
jgi:5-methylcytosine-specific restriction endonuclease McrA